MGMRRVSKLFESMESIMGGSGFDSLVFEVFHFTVTLMCASVGLLALISPRHFAYLSKVSAQKVVDLDNHLLRFSRLLGMVGVVTAAFLIYLYFVI
jgi:hypothetical protein